MGQSRTIAVYAKSMGSADLTITSASSSSPLVTLAPSPALPVTLPYYQSSDLKAKFTPTSAGAVSGTINVVSNDPRQPTFAIAWKGTGGSSTGNCTYGVYPKSIAFGPGEDSESVYVPAPSGCAWSASASGFATLSASSGSGQGSTSVRATSNPGASPRTATVTIAGLTVNVTQASPGATRTTFVPVVLSTAGAAGSFYTSERTLANRGTTDAVVEPTYTPFLSTGAGVGVDVLPAGRQLIFPDTLAYLRSLGIPIPESGNRGGTISVKFSGLSSASAGSATVRTTTAVPEGAAGLSYSAVPAGLSDASYVCGLRQTATDRSNLAVMNLGASGDVVLRLTVHSGDSAVSKVLPDIGLAPGDFAQVSGILGSNGLSLTNGYVKVERVSGANPYYAYGVINDQANSDGSLVPGARSVSGALRAERFRRVARGPDRGYASATAPRTAAITSSACASVIAGQSGMVSVESPMRSAFGNMPRRKPKRSA